MKNIYFYLPVFIYCYGFLTIYSFMIHLPNKILFIGWNLAHNVLIYHEEQNSLFDITKTCLFIIFIL